MLRCRALNNKSHTLSLGEMVIAVFERRHVAIPDEESIDAAVDQDVKSKLIEE